MVAGISGRINFCTASTGATLRALGVRDKDDLAPAGGHLLHI